MAEYCPKCHYKLRIRDWRPECPKCGVNMMYYGIEDRLRAEADKAEYQHAKTQPRFDRFKFSLIGHPLSIVRLVLGLLPFAAAMLPMGTLCFALPFSETKETVNLVSVISFVTGKRFDMNLITKLCGSSLLGKAMTVWTVALFSFLLVVILTVVGFLLLTLSASPKGFQRNVIIPSLCIVFATVSQISFAAAINAFSEALPGIFSGSVNPAAYIAAVVVYAAMIAVNIIYRKKNIQVKYKDVSEFLLPYNERPSTKAKLQKQEVNI